MCQPGPVDVIFERTGQRRYAVEVRTERAPLRMDPAPGFHELFPHDLQHLIVEEQLGLTDGIYGRLAKGGTASSFHPLASSGAGSGSGTGGGSKRHRARQQRKLNRRNASLAASEGKNVGGNDFARSERATLVAWHDWMQHASDRELRLEARSLHETATAILARVDEDERLALVTALPRLRERITEVTDRWRATQIGDSITIPWAPLPRASRGR